MTGKNTRTAAISALDSGFRSPNQLLSRGANAMIGTALAATASGRRIPRAVSHRADTNATTTPATVPIDRPRIASWNVAIADGKSGNRPPDQFACNAATIADGLGSRNDSNLRTAKISSQPTIATMKTTTAGRS